jgi:hypothetical protein
MVLSTAFTGSNGTAWPSPWTTSLQGGTTNGAIDIQSNRGRMRAHDGGYRRARASAAVTVGNATYEVTFNLQGVTEQYGYLHFRTSGDWTSGFEWLKNGYALRVGAYPDGGYSLIRTAAGVETTLAGVPFTFTAGVDYKAKINFVGTTLRAKVWLAAGSEPSGWTLQADDSTYTSGGIDISLLSGATGNDRQWIVDDVVVTASSPSADTASAFTSYLTVTTDTNPSAPGASAWTDWLVATTDVAPSGQVRKFRRDGAWVSTSNRQFRRNGVWV